MPSPPLPIPEQISMPDYRIPRLIPLQLTVPLIVPASSQTPRLGIVFLCESLTILFFKRPVFIGCFSCSIPCFVKNVFLSIVVFLMSSR